MLWISGSNSVLHLKHSSISLLLQLWLNHWSSTLKVATFYIERSRNIHTIVPILWMLLPLCLRWYIFNQNKIGILLLWEILNFNFSSWISPLKQNYKVHPYSPLKPNISSASKMFDIRRTKFGFLLLNVCVFFNPGKRSYFLGFFLGGFDAHDSLNSVKYKIKASINRNFNWIFFCWNFDILSCTVQLLMKLSGINRGRA